MKNINDTYKKLATDLVNRYNISAQLINKLLAAYHLNEYEEIVGRLGKIDKLILVLNTTGFNIFSGNSDITKELRKKIIEQWDIDIINKLYESRKKEHGKTITHRVRVLAEQKWHNGKGWAITFTENSGFDIAFAGIDNTQIKRDDYEDIVPYIKPPALKDFQVYLKDKIIENLKCLGDNAKCMISLPTGGGKTRTAVEAYIEWLRPRFSEGKYLVWIAQSEELCEQAIASIKQVWSSKEFTESLRIYRLFKNHSIDKQTMVGGVIIAGINKLYNLIKSNNIEVSQEIFNNCGAMIIDEAHRSTSMMYDIIFTKAKEVKGDSIFPICGLTATPGRSKDTIELCHLFKLKLFTPILGEKYENNPLQYFREKGYLATPKFHVISTNHKIIIKEDIEFDSFVDDLKTKLEDIFNKTYNKELAKNSDRNKRIIETLLKVPLKEPSLVYACTVQHAQFLSSILAYYGRKTAVITADTPNNLRRLYIEKFKKSEIDFIFNHSVLTTGFDAPKTQNIFLCRPIFSDVLYEQIVGRGLRGPEFGGTKTCNIYDFSDTILRYGDQKSYNRYKSSWEVSQ